jgi:hypothetical protein
MMQLTEGAETSENHNLTPGNYPKQHIQYLKHGESLKSRMYLFDFNNTIFSYVQTTPDKNVCILYSVFA